MNGEMIDRQNEMICFCLLLPQSAPPHILHIKEEEDSRPGEQRLTKHTCGNMDCTV